MIRKRREKSSAKFPMVAGFTRRTRTYGLGSKKPKRTWRESSCSPTTGGTGQPYGVRRRCSRKRRPKRSRRCRCWRTRSRNFMKAPCVRTATCDLPINTIRWMKSTPGKMWWAWADGQLQGLSRTQPSLPCVPEHCATKTQDYGRKGITNLFAAMNVHSGEIVYTFHPQHRHEEWIQFLSLIEIATPPGKEIHLIMDNYSAHKHVAVSQWLDEHPRFHVHWTPTSGSWLNAVERLFGDVTQKCLRRRSVDSVAALEQAIGDFLDKRNQNPKPLKWKATAVEILRKVQRAWATLHDLYGAKKPSAALASIDSFLTPAPS